MDDGTAQICRSPQVWAVFLLLGCSEPMVPVVENRSSGDFIHFFLTDGCKPHKKIKKRKTESVFSVPKWVWAWKS